jgi:anti-sigma B factor antagonist
MDIRERRSGSVVVVTLIGDLDSRSSPEARERLAGLLAEHQRLVVDLTDVPYMSSVGLRTMLLMYREAQCVNARVALVGLSAELRALMAATGFLRFFMVEESVSACVDALRDGSEERSDEPVARA